MKLKPCEFVDYVKTIARETRFPFEQILLGGDHLGPSPWKGEPAQSAMHKSTEMVRQYVRSGYRKIHLDASMPCLGDPDPLPKEIVAEREAQLCLAAIEENRMMGKKITDLVFVVGTEVPAPGGSNIDDDSVQVSSAAETEENIAAIKKTFANYQLDAAWERILAFVVQPGVEFSDSHIHAYQQASVRELSALIDNYGNLVYEAHSTDYQTRLNLRQMVMDHFAILKVGPALTFALREALFSLEDIEAEILHGETVLLSNFREVLDQAMHANPRFWDKYYSQEERTQYLQRKYSLLDRSRYYLNNSEVEQSIRRLISNLASQKIPFSLIWQYFPDLAQGMDPDLLNNNPRELILGKIEHVLEDYVYACIPCSQEVPAGCYQSH